MKYLIIYNEIEVHSASEFIEGTAVVTGNNFMVSELSTAIQMLNAMEIDSDKINELI